MSKKKNTLNDLEEFLKLQASALITPPALSEQVKKVEPSPPASTVLVKQPPKDIVEEVKTFAKVDKRAFYDLIIQVAGDLPNSSQDTLLINTALYLKNGDRWQDAIREYWRGTK